MIDTREVTQRRQEMSSEIITGMAEWRQQHPKAMLREIEAALDERLERLRAKNGGRSGFVGSSQGMGGLLGTCFLLLTYTGRKSRRAFTHTTCLVATSTPTS
jgi:hypothetical protein